MFEQPSLALIRSLLVGSSTSASEPFWNGQQRGSSIVHSSELEPSTSAPVRSSGYADAGHWASYQEIASPDTESMESRPPSVQILTPPLTLSPSSPVVVSQQQQQQQLMSLATRRQIDEFEELIEKIDRLNGGDPSRFDEDSRMSPFLRSSGRHSEDTPHLTALLVQSNPQNLCSDRSIVASFPLTSRRSRRTPTGRTSAIDDDFEILLEENPSLLDPPLPSSSSTCLSSSMRMMMDTLEKHCSRNVTSSMFASEANNESSARQSAGHDVDHLIGQETNVKQEMDEDDDEVVECGRTNSSSVRQGFTSPIPTRYLGPPTSLKSATMTTRTNLKQLLQMQQFHEMERKEQSKSGMSTSPVGSGGIGVGGTSGCGGAGPFSTSTSVSVPMQPILPSRMEVPSEVLKVHSQLENPTRYHVQENRKRQVQEYLSTTQGNARSILAQSVPVGVAGGAVGGAGGCGAGTSAPSMSNNNVSAAAAIKGSTQSPDSPNSVILSSSAATSVTSEADVIESIMQLESSMDTEHTAYLPQPSTLPTSANFLDVLKMSSTQSCPPDVPVSNMDALQFTHVQLHAIAKDRQKKDNHNMIERRRRFNINDRIKELGTLLPRSNDPYYDMIRIDRQNKGTILKATVDYVKQMRKELDRVKMELGEKDQENRKLRLQNVQLAAMHSVSSGSSGVEVNNWPDSLTGLSNTFAKEELRIKEEPLDSSCVDRFHQQMSPFDDLMDEDEPVHGDPLLSSSMLGNNL